MTANVQLESKSPSRRALLAGVLGGLGALAASAVGRVTPVRADNGDPMIVGGAHTASSTTQVSTTGFAGLKGISSHTTGDGVTGTSTAIAGLASGVRGESFSTSGRGVLGQAKAVTGATYGVVGESGSTSGTGVLGLALSATGPTYGVAGQSLSPAGVGVYAAAGAGVALRTAGRVKFSTSGVASITAGNTSKTVTPGVNVTAGSFVLLTPKANIGSRALWFTTNATANTFRIRMSSSRSSTTKVAWMLLG